jgi:hypothetical protein
VLRVDSEPPGALIRLDGVELGPAPVEKEFTYGGVREIEARLEGHETVRALIPVRLPLWSRFPFDLVFEALLPFPHVDVHEVRLRLAPSTPQLPPEPTDAGEILERARELRLAGPEAARHKRP